eukprot:GHVS01028065.1.p1 GENE.GHVS01028065.1~~GHVS01028065.1.p1  ORF type:complete len:709 (-),score=119.94 GHVS01028065.1:189-2231(-)
MEAPVLAAACISASKDCCKQKGLWKAYARRAGALIDKLSGREIALICRSFARSNHKDLSLLYNFTQKLVALNNQLTPHNLYAITTAYASLEVHDTALFKLVGTLLPPLLRSASDNISSFQPTYLAGIVHSLGKLQLQDPSILSLAAHWFLSHPPSFIDLAIVCSAFSTLNFLHTAFFDFAAKQTLSHLHQTPPPVDGAREAAMISRAFDQFRLYPTDLHESIALHLANQLVSSTHQPSLYSLCVVASVVAKRLSSTHPTLVAIYAHLCAQLAADASSLSSRDLVFALRVLSQQQQQSLPTHAAALDNLTASIRARPNLTAQQLASVALSLSKQGRAHAFLDSRVLMMLSEKEEEELVERGFSFDDLVSLLALYQSNSSLSCTIICALEKKLPTKASAVSIEQVAVLLSAMSRERYRSGGSDVVCAVLEGLVDSADELSTVLLSSLVLSLAKLSFPIHPRLLASLIKRILNTTGEGCTQAATNLLYSVALKGPSAEDAAASFSLEQLSRSITAIPSCTAFTQLAIVNLLTPCPHLELLLANSPPPPQPTNQSGFHREVLRAIDATVSAGTPCSAEVSYGQGAYSIDVLLEDLKVAIEADGPYHYYRGSRQLTASTTLKHRVLEFSYKLVAIPYWEWAELEGNLDSQISYLSSRIYGATERACNQSRCHTSSGTNRSMAVAA